MPSLNSFVPSIEFEQFLKGELGFYSLLRRNESRFDYAFFVPCSFPAGICHGVKVGV